MLQLLPHQRQHKPRRAQSIAPNLGSGICRLPRPPFPACDGPLRNPAEPAPRSYWQRQALREALQAALVTTLMTAAVQAAPQLFTQSPALSVQQIKAMLLPGFDDSAQPRLFDCP
jgi:hypothetical protein